MTTHGVTMAAATGTIEAKPHDINPRGSVNCDVAYIPGDPPGMAVRPNDVHIEYRKLSSGVFGQPDWENGLPANETDVPMGANPVGGMKKSFQGPTDPGTYDLRVRWTLNGETIAERIGQFSVKPPRSTKYDTPIGTATGITVGAIVGIVVALALAGMPIPFLTGLILVLVGFVIGGFFGGLIGVIVDWILSQLFK